MSAEVLKYTLEQVEALELAPGTEHEKLEGWIPELAGEDEVRAGARKGLRLSRRRDASRSSPARRLRLTSSTGTPAPRWLSRGCNTSRPKRMTSAS